MSVNAAPQIPFFIADSGSPEYVWLDEALDQSGPARTTRHTRYQYVLPVADAALREKLGED
jgi:hypothetical protein